MIKRTSIHDLGKLNLREEDKPLVREEILKGSDRSAALMACSLVDLALVYAIAGHMVGPDTDKTRQDRFYGSRSILPDMATRVAFGRAIGMFASKAEAMLDNVRRVRNAFAHSPKVLTFDELAIREVCLKLTSVKLTQVFPDAPQHDEMRGRYVATCLQLQIVLNDHGDTIRKVPKIIYIPDA